MGRNKISKGLSIFFLFLTLIGSLFYSDTNSKNPTSEVFQNSLISFTGIGKPYIQSGEISRETPKRDFSIKQILDISLMGFEFLLVYIFVLGMTYYAAQTAGLYRFVKRKQNKLNQTETLYFFLKKKIGNGAFWRKGDTYKTIFSILLKIILKILLYFMLFSPAYVIAYSFKTDIDTDSLFFMIVLGIVSNGLLINYANRFYTYLEEESKKGYTLTAAVKNLNTSYDPSIITFRSLLKIKKEFPGHLLDHIFMNARFQYIQTVKEQAAFLISGLIIIEMALNIQGRICYELLKNILYGNYEIVIFISIILFAIVKMTYVLIDLWYRVESRKYGY